MDHNTKAINPQAETNRLLREQNQKLDDIHSTLDSLRNIIETALNNRTL